jgi:hypothetical protein
LNASPPTSEAAPEAVHAPAETAPPPAETAPAPVSAEDAARAGYDDDKKKLQGIQADMRALSAQLASATGEEMVRLNAEIAAKLQEIGPVASRISSEVDTVTLARARAEGKIDDNAIASQAADVAAAAQGREPKALLKSLEGKSRAEILAIREKLGASGCDLDAALAALPEGDRTQAKAEMSGDPVAAKAAALVNATSGDKPADKAEMLATLADIRPEERAAVEAELEKTTGHTLGDVTGKLTGADRMKAEALAAGDADMARKIDEDPAAAGAEWTQKKADQAAAESAAAAEDEKKTLARKAERLEALKADVTAGTQAIEAATGAEKLRLLQEQQDKILEMARTGGEVADLGAEIKARTEGKIDQQKIDQSAGTISAALESNDPKALHAALKGKSRVEVLAIEERYKAEHGVDLGAKIDEAIPKEELEQTKAELSGDSAKIAALGLAKATPKDGKVDMAGLLAAVNDCKPEDRPRLAEEYEARTGKSFDDALGDMRTEDRLKAQAAIAGKKASDVAGEQIKSAEQDIADRKAAVAGDSSLSDKDKQRQLRALDRELREKTEDLQVGGALADGNKLDLDAARKAAAEIFAAVEGTDTDAKRVEAALHDALFNRNLPPEQLALIKQQFRKDYTNRGKFNSHGEQRDIDDYFTWSRGTSEVSPADLVQIRTMLAGDRQGTVEAEIVSSMSQHSFWSGDYSHVDKDRLNAALDDLHLAGIDKETIEKSLAGRYDKADIHELLKDKVSGANALRVAEAHEDGDPNKIDAAELFQAKDKFLGADTEKEAEIIKRNAERNHGNIGKLDEEFKQIPGNTSVKEDVIDKMDRGAERDRASAYASGNETDAAAAELSLAFGDPVKAKMMNMFASGDADYKKVLATFEGVEGRIAAKYVKEGMSPEERRAALEKADAEAKVERGKIIEQFNALYGANGTNGTGMSHADFGAWMQKQLGMNAKEVEALVDTGKLSPAGAMKLAVEKGDKDLIEKTLEGKSKDDIKNMYEDFARKQYGDLDAAVDGLHGDKRHEAQQLLKGKPENAREALQRMHEDWVYARTSGNKQTGFTDLFTGTGDVVDADEREVEALFLRLDAKGNTTSDHDQELLERLTGFHKANDQNYKAAEDKITNAAVAIVAAPVAMAVTVATGGAAGAILGPLAGGLVTVAMKSAFKGDRLGLDEVKGDVINAVAGAAAGGVMASGAVTGALGKIGETIAEKATPMIGKAGATVVAEGVGGALAGAGNAVISGTVSGALNGDLNLGAIGKGALGGVAGGLGSGLVGGAMGLKDAVGNKIVEDGLGKDLAKSAAGTLSTAAVTGQSGEELAMGLAGGLLGAATGAGVHHLAEGPSAHAAPKAAEAAPAAETPGGAAPPTPAPAAQVDVPAAAAPAVDVKPIVMVGGAAEPAVPAPAPSVIPNAATVPAPVDPHAPTMPAPTPVDPHAPTPAPVPEPASAPRHDDVRPSAPATLPCPGVEPPPASVPIEPAPKTLPAGTPPGKAPVEAPLPEPVAPPPASERIEPSPSTKRSPGVQPPGHPETPGPEIPIIEPPPATPIPVPAPAPSDPWHPQLEPFRKNDPGLLSYGPPGSSQPAPMSVDPYAPR